MRTLSSTFGIIAVLIILAILLFGFTFLLTYLFPKLKQYKFKIFIIFYILALCLPIGMIFGEIYGSIFPYIYIVGAFSLGFFLLTSFVIIPFSIIAKIRNKEFGKIGKILIAIFCIIINGHAIYAGFVPQVIEYKISINKNHNHHGKKILVISDTHYGYIHGEMEAKYLVEKINALNPDIVLIPGDLYDGPKIDFEKIAKILNNISAPTFYVNGNHEEYRNTSGILSALESTDITILNDANYNQYGINISGVAYHTNKTAEQLTNTLTNIAPQNPDEINILMRHEPTLHNIVEKFGYDLVVSGHTHKGQMWPFSLITTNIYGKYVHGLVQDNSLYSMTTSGVGNWGPPQRFLTRSEIVLITIE